MSTRHVLKYNRQVKNLLGQSGYSQPFGCLQQQQRTLWNGKLKRGLTLAVIGSTSLLGMVVIGPFLLIGIGGITAVLGFRYWQFKKRFLAGGQQGFLNEFFLKQQVFSKEKLKVESKAMQRLKSWAQTEQGRHCLIENGIHPERLVENVSIRGSSFTMLNNSTSKEIKIELELGNSPRSVLVALAEIDIEGNISLTEIKLVSSTGNIINVPLQHNEGRVIEGEFRDV